MDSIFVVMNMMNFNGPYEYILEETFGHISDNLGDIIMIFPYMGENCDQRLHSLIKSIREKGYSGDTKINFVLDQNDILNMSEVDCKCLVINGVGVYTKGDTIKVQNGINVQCDDLIKDSLTDEELDDMFLELHFDNKNQKNHVYALAWDGSSLDDRLLRFGERLLLVCPVSEKNLVRVFSYCYDDKELLSYSLGTDKKQYDKSLKHIYIDEKEFNCSGPSKIKI